MLKMKNYTVRIELWSNLFSNFQILHKEMNNRGFRKTIISDEGMEYYLPRSVYVTYGFSTNEVLLKAQEAVNRTDSQAEILVLETNECRWTGLVPVK